jgi:hypothetical protein
MPKASTLGYTEAHFAYLSGKRFAPIAIGTHPNSLISPQLYEILAIKEVKNNRDP